MPVHFIFTDLLELITAKDANISFQNPYLLEVGWSLFFQSLLATVIDSDVTACSENLGAIFLNEIFYDILPLKSKRAFNQSRVSQKWF